MISLNVVDQFDIDNVIGNKDDHGVELSDSQSFKISEKDYNQRTDSSRS